MYEVSVNNYADTIDKTWKFLEWEYAWQVFLTASNCVDCETATLHDAVTGEIYAQSEDHLVTIYSFPEEEEEEE